TLSETGIGGFALLAVIVIALSAGLARTARELGGLGRACCVSALLVAAYFLVHDSLDWLDEFPALAAPALALALAAIQLCALGGRRRGGAPGRLAVTLAPLVRPTARLAVRAVAGGGLVVTGAAIGLALYGP